MPELPRPIAPSFPDRISADGGPSIPHGGNHPSLTAYLPHHQPSGESPVQMQQAPMDPQDRACPWYAAPQNPVLPTVSGLPLDWEIAFKTQLTRWRTNGKTYRKANQGKQHGMIPWQTWAWAVSQPQGEPIGVSEAQPARERLVLVCLPPGVVVSEMDKICCSYPYSLGRPANAARSPQWVHTVSDSPHLLSPEALEDLAWGAALERSAFVGEMMHPTSQSE